jgi:DNA-binding MarR family transcriptional regulator
MIVLHPPDSPIAHLLPQISRRHFRRIHALLGDLGLYRGQPVLLAVLWEHEGFAHSELAQHLGVTPATITKMVQRMEQAGFVSRQPDRADQRISRVYLTEKGRLIRHQVDEVFRTLEADMMAGFDEAEREQLLGYLQRVAANLERNRAGGPPVAEDESQSAPDQVFPEEITH